MVMTLVRSVTISSVDVFVIITGFFLCTNQVRSLGKPLSLLFQVSVYSVIIVITLSLLGYSDLSAKGVLFSLVPSNWFVTLYVVLYLISPYLNHILSHLTYKTWIYYLTILLAFFSIWPMIIGMAGHFGVMLEGLSTYGRGGNNAGYTLVNFIVLYSIGAFCRMNEIDKKIKTWFLLLVIVVSVLLLWGIRFIPLNTTPWHVAGWYDNILVIALATCLFLFFKKMHFTSVVINKLSAAAFACYIIHGYCLKIACPEIVLSMPLYEALGIIGIFIIGIYLLSWCLYSLYTVSIGRLFKKLDNYKFDLI